jgi:hypothetical protein
LRRLSSLVVAMLFVVSACSIDRAPRGDALLPDLVPVPVTEIRTRPAADDRPPSMLFTGIVANRGSGPLLLDGSLDDDGWQVDQRIRYSEAGEEIVSTEATAVFGGDGHEHWHIERIVVYHLESESGEVLGHDSKVGFCFFDFDPVDDPPPGAPDRQQYVSDSCGDFADRAFEMGLSVGWVDTYPWWLDGQEIEISGLTEGRYRIVATVDPEGWFTESDTDNNVVASTFDLHYRESDGAPVIRLIDDEG